MAGERTKGDSVFRVFVEKLGATDREVFVGNSGDLFYDPTTAELYISDGITVGGIPLSNQLLGDLIDGIGELPDNNLEGLIEALEQALVIKYDKTGGPISGNLTVSGLASAVGGLKVSKETARSGDDVFTVDSAGQGGSDFKVNRSGAFVSKNPVEDLQVANKGYVDSTTIPFNISKLASITSDG